jgi:hypothetical protein
VNGRSYLSLTLTTPGVILGGSQGLKSNTSTFTVRNNQSIWVSGQRESSVNYIIDGIETRNNRWANVSFRPSIDMINEFKIERNAYGGEIAIDGGTVVNISTKAGTNQFHGTVFEFFRNTDLNARNFFDRERAPFQDNNFGGIIGGPLATRPDAAGPGPLTRPVPGKPRRRFRRNRDLPDRFFHLSG